jgi:hypothetical protein
MQIGLTMYDCPGFQIGTLRSLVDDSKLDASAFCPIRTVAFNLFPSCFSFA